LIIWNADISCFIIYIYIFQGAYERPEKYVPKINKTTKVKKIYK
jgi:hypothetical protein